MERFAVRVLVALDSFKGSLDAASACRSVAAGICNVHPDAQCTLLPMADGGEGTAAAILGARDGEWVRRRVTGPLPDRKVDASYAWVRQDRLAVIEMSAAGGLPLLAREERDPLRTTTYGTGELLGMAAADPVDAIWLGVGGSATVDGGTGAARALGWKFLDSNGNETPLGGGALGSIARIEPPSVPFPKPVRVLCDVDNPLCGPEGAAAVFGPQKGATPEMVEVLEKGLAHLAARVRDALGIDIEELPGGGAAGGLAAGAAAFLNGELVSGIDAVIEETRLERALKGADWVVTGEGCLDRSSFRGKVLAGVLRAARRHRVPVAVLAGTTDLQESTWRGEGITAVCTLAEEGRAEEEAMSRAPELLTTAAEQLTKKMRNNCDR